MAHFVIYNSEGEVYISGKGDMSHGAYRWRPFDGMECYFDEDAIKGLVASYKTSPITLPEFIFVSKTLIDAVDKALDNTWIVSSGDNGYPNFEQAFRLRDAIDSGV